jgi:DNA polymerase-4
MPSAGLCRDCLARVGPGETRCAACGSPRLLRHPDQDRLTVAHVDCDAFFAAVEKRDRPELRDQPVIVGGRQRGVVLTACYIARTFGIRSAMPMFKALAACPHAVVVRPDGAKYRAVGQEVRRMMRALTPLVEPVSIDEAYLDLAGTERLHGASPATVLARFARQVEAEIGITVSVGLSCNKLLAKIASDRDKPRGFSVIGPAEAPALLAGCQIGILPGIGPRAQARLARAGILLVGDLHRADPTRLAGALGHEAEPVLRMARGEDVRPVRTSREAKSVSAETTFGADLQGYEDLQPILWRLCEKVSHRLKESELAGRSLTLKLKDSGFRISTRSRSGLPPTQLAARLFEPARTLLRQACDGRPYRLIGIGAGDLCGAEAADRGDLADPHAREEQRREAAMDRIRDKFGADAVQRGLAFPWAQRGQAFSGKS